MSKQGRLDFLQRFRLVSTRNRCYFFKLFFFFICFERILFEVWIGSTNHQKKLQNPHLSSGMVGIPGFSVNPMHCKRHLVIFVQNLQELTDLFLKTLVCVFSKGLLVKGYKGPIQSVINCLRNCFDNSSNVWTIVLTIVWKYENCCRIVWQLFDNSLTQTFAAKISTNHLRRKVVCFEVILIYIYIQICKLQNLYKPFAEKTGLLLKFFR